MTLGGGVVDPDADLVARVAGGDGAAAAALIDRHMRPMTDLAFRMLGDAQEAEDVVQDLYVKVWRNAAKWTPGRAKFSTWMHRVAINLCYDRLRKRRETPLSEPPETIDDGLAPDEALSEQETSAIVRAAIGALPERQRAAIVLCHYRHLGNIEAAEALGVSVEALESLLARGRRALRTKLAPMAEELL